MITLINATNRPENLTGKVIYQYAKILDKMNMAYQIFEVTDLQDDFIFSASFGQSSAHLAQIIKDKIVSAQKLVFFAPEYNGSYPGILKSFIDVVPPKYFEGKRAALVGVATGRAGNIRGMDHLTDVLHHLAVEVLSFKIPISQMHNLLNADGELADPETLGMLQKQAEKLKAF